GSNVQTDRSAHPRKVEIGLPLLDLIHQARHLASRTNQAEVRLFLPRTTTEQIHVQVVIVGADDDEATASPSELALDGMFRIEREAHCIRKAFGRVQLFAF